MLSRETAGTSVSPHFLLAGVETEETEGRHDDHRLGHDEDDGGDHHHRHLLRHLLEQDVETALRGK